ncbi:acyltransferase family protein [Rhodococcus hoagii]|nr:acyltransferase family protein [Prescottella equi]NKT35954.1 acyltransferase family protein [Prescottella equi]NKT39269.1 acyltransferase family protein [Prescottella equi]NKT61648.1 acyltransferase family protein [Prescottella equi]NKT75897.1 acyltransferase family protein [Prescottella equi]
MKSVLVTSSGVGPGPSRSGSRGNPPSAPVHTQRLDIQGLRMVAVLLVVLSHLFHWPQGGFIGVDVFFVISGFLITGSLLHTLEKTGRISFSSFYRRRVRRIVPAATLVLVATVAVSYFVFTGSRFTSTAWDAVAAFFFVSNWRFGIEGTDYFNSSGPVSALQHYWSLSVEEQFYFVWPAVIFAIGVIVTRKAWSRQVRLAISATVMGAVVLASFVYAVLDTSGNPTWAYFSTLTRVWELGVGALLAITISWFERIPDAVRPFIAWTGLALIAVGAFAISETGGGFPAPWAAVPVLGSALVIGAGVAGNHRFLGVLTNRYSTYVGDISYSLYLWHWPVIILLGALMDRGVYYYAASLFLMFGFSIAAYHFFENPIRQSNWLLNDGERLDRRILDRSRWRLPSVKMSDSHKNIAIGSLAMITAGVAAFALVPTTVSVAPVSAYSPQGSSAAATSARGPEQDALAAELAAASSATSWPDDLSPSMEDVTSRKRSGATGLIGDCAGLNPPSLSQCTAGNANAPKSIVVLGDSTAMLYTETFRNIAEASNGQWKTQMLAMSGCAFADGRFAAPNAAIQDACPTHVADAIAHVKSTRPDIVVISNDYTPRKDAESKATISTEERAQLEESAIKQIADSAGKVVLLAPPPSGADVRECYTRQSTPSNCITKISDGWSATSTTTGIMAKRNGWVHINTVPLYCTQNLVCPSFAGGVPIKVDQVHLSYEYANKIVPALREQFTQAGVPL